MLAKFQLEKKRKHVSQNLKAIIIAPFFLSRHAVQSLSPPLTLTITPVNSHSPQITTPYQQSTYVENTVLDALRGVTLSDADEICAENVIVAARIEVVTSASDNAEELLDVCTLLYIEKGVASIMYMCYLSLSDWLY